MPSDPKGHVTPLKLHTVSDESIDFSAEHAESSHWPSYSQTHPGGGAAGVGTYCPPWQYAPGRHGHVRVAARTCTGSAITHSMVAMATKMMVRARLIGAAAWLCQLRGNRIVQHT